MVVVKDFEFIADQNKERKSERINHLPSESSIFFMVPSSNRTKKKQKVTDQSDGTRIVIDLNLGIGK